MLVEFEELVDDGDEVEDEACGTDAVGVPVAGGVAVVVGEVAGEVIAVALAGAA